MHVSDPTIHLELIYVIDSDISTKLGENAKTTVISFGGIKIFYYSNSIN